MIKPRDSNRLLIFFFALFALFLIATTAHFHLIVKPQQVNLNTKGISNVKSLHKTINSKLSTIASDLLILKQLNELQVVQTAGQIKVTKLQLGKLAKEFVSLSNERGFYDQIRLLDMGGMELVRVNYNNGNPRVVAEKKLQKKLDRYYFREALALGPGEIYLSHLDLNLEHGRIEKPLKPILRVGTPLFNKQGQKKGLLLLNYMGNDLLNSIRKKALNISGRVHIVNEQGYWIIAPNSDDEWGFRLGHGLSFAKKYPEVWNRITDKIFGLLSREQGIFVYTTVSLTNAIKQEQVKMSGLGDSISIDIEYGNGPKRHWKIIAHLPSVQLSPNYNDYLKRNIIKIVWIILLLFLVSMVLVRMVGKGKTEHRHKPRRH